MNFEGMARMRWLMLPMDHQVHWAASLPLLLYWCLHVYLGNQFLAAQRLRYFEMQYQQGEFQDEDPLSFVHQHLQWYRVFIDATRAGMAEE